MKTLLLLMSLLFVPQAFAEGITIIVNEKNPIAEMSTDQIAGYFLKKQRQWPDGSALRFFDREDEAPERRLFLRKIVRKTPREVELFWIGQKLYTGHSAPIQVSTDSMMVAMVARFPGAIGYVSESYDRLKGVKVLGVLAE